jgi:predicted nucleic-acid-binding protein
MIGVDTNVLLRHLVHDDPRQSALALRFFEARTPDDPAFIAQLALAETVWSLSQTYRVPAAQLRRIVRSLLSSSDVVFENSIGIRRALRDAEDANVDLADAIIAHAAIDAGCDGVVTFDKAAQRLPGMLPVG